ncbi:MAG TPA: Hsp70 family protein [Phytomonospora sp.]
MAKRALVIANSVYDDENFAALPGARADAVGLAGVLGDPEIGGFDVASLVDVGQREAMRALEAFFGGAARDDLLLLHLSLHGWKDLRNRLFFVMKDTERDLPTATAIAADTISDWITHCRSRRIVLTLDCCYSGAFPLGTLRRSETVPRVDVAEPLSGKGRAVITASTSLQYAHESGENVRSSRPGAQPSVFTSAIVEGLRDGSADIDGDGYVSVGDLYDYVHERVRRKVAGQTPTLSVDNTQGVLRLARSPRNPDADMLGEMRSGVAASQSWKRIGALHLVERLLGSVREPTRETAHAALLGLVKDGDPEVARRARDLWHSRGLGELPSEAGRTASRPGTMGRAVVGSDFGTTNSAVAVYHDGDVRLIPSAEGALTTPSVVALLADGGVLVGEAARRQAALNPEYTARSVKLKLGTDWSIARGSLRLSAEQVAGLILAKLKADAEAYLGVPVDEAVLTVPAVFGRAQQAALLAAARGVKLYVTRTISEPTAAAMVVGTRSDDDRNALVFDLGGGTLDVSVVSIGDGIVEVLATAGDNALGGDDWDHHLALRVAERLRYRDGTDLRGDVAAMQRLREAAEAAKIELSAASTARIRLPYLATTVDGTVHVDEIVTRNDLALCSEDLLRRCSDVVKRALAESYLPLAELDLVILTGGATRMPAIADMVSEATGGKHVYRGVIPDGIVAGAALQAGILNGTVKDTLLLDTTSLSIGVWTSDGGVTRLIERHSSVPAKRSENFLRAARDGGSAAICLVEGESPTAAENKPLAFLELGGLGHDLDTGPELEIVADIDANHLIHVSARDLKTGARVGTLVDMRSIDRAAGLVASPDWAGHVARMPTHTRTPPPDSPSPA